MPGEASKPDEIKAITEQLDALFAPWNRSDAPGLTVGVAKDGRIIYRRGFGMASVETCVANSPKTRMRIGSTSKHFTCLLALLLVDEGKLDLDAPIRTYIPELVGPSGDPSVRLLLQHRGGSRCYLDIGFLCHGMTPPPLGTALATQVRQTGCNFAAGEAMLYNNGGYHLVSLAIERVGGAPFEAQLKQRLFDPLGMVDTASIQSDYEITPGIANMHVPLSGGRWRRGLFPSEEIRGEGAIVSTIDDMLRWTAHLHARDRFGSPAVWATLTEQPTFPGGTVGVYALGLVLNTYRGVRVVHHAGGVIGGSSQMLIVPDHGLDIVILANGAPGATPIKLVDRVVDIVLARQLGEPASTIVAADYEALFGDWWSPDSGMIYRLIGEEGALKLSLCGDPFALTLERLSDGRVVSASFVVSEIGVELDEAAHGGDLTIRFGGRSAAYRKVSKETADAAVFAQAAIGEYHSDDADCTATIARDGERLVIAFSDPYGRLEAVTHPLSETVAYIEPSSPLVPLHAALTLALDDARVTGFRVNTARTRDLVFNRMYAAGQ
jgi:D-aminopeptidase